MTNSVIKRFKTYKVQTEVYHTSDKQKEVRKEMRFCVKTRLDFLSSSKFAKMATLDGQRGVRAAKSRTLSDGAPSPAYMVEWMCAIQTNILSRGKLRVQENG